MLSSEPIAIPTDVPTSAPAHSRQPAVLPPSFLRLRSGQAFILITANAVNRLVNLGDWAEAHHQLCAVMA